MTNKPEALGMALAAKSVGMPIVISVTLELDGRLPDGSELGEVISTIDQLTDSYPLCYMVNCVHPSLVEEVLQKAKSEGASWLSSSADYSKDESGSLHESSEHKHSPHLSHLYRSTSRFAGIRANASPKSHAELDNSTVLEDGDPVALGQHVTRLASEYDFWIVGGCCGTDSRHVCKMLL
jgi:homocysteine S-methyltransferase